MVLSKSMPIRNFGAMAEGVKFLPRILNMI